MAIHPDIEKVARALCRTRTVNDGEDYIESSWRGFIDDAKCAILATLDAIREPTDAMVEAGAKFGCDCDECPSPEATADDMWLAMIGAKKTEIKRVEKP